MQARIRKRGQSSKIFGESHFIKGYTFVMNFFISMKKKDVWSYTYTVRIKQEAQTVETRRQIDKREYAVSDFSKNTKHKY
jgi:hypothetical protein